MILQRLFLKVLVREGSQKRDAGKEIGKLDRGRMMRSFHIQLTISGSSLRQRVNYTKIVVDK